MPLDSWLFSTAALSLVVISIAVSDIPGTAIPIPIEVDSLAVDSVMNADVASISLPDSARSLHGQKVRLSGIMYPTLESTGLTEYTIIPETDRRPIGLMAGKPIPLHAMIPVTTIKGHTENYQERPFTIEGIFEIRIQSDDDGVYSLYRIRDAQIIEFNSRLNYQTALVWVLC